MEYIPYAFCNSVFHHFFVDDFSDLSDEFSDLKPTVWQDALNDHLVLRLEYTVCIGKQHSWEFYHRKIKDDGEDVPELPPDRWMYVIAVRSYRGLAAIYSLNELKHISKSHLRCTGIQIMYEISEALSTFNLTSWSEGRLEDLLEVIMEPGLPCILELYVPVIPDWALSLLKTCYITEIVIYNGFQKEVQKSEKFLMDIFSDSTNNIDHLQLGGNWDKNEEISRSLENYKKENAKFTVRLDRLYSGMRCKIDLSADVFNGGKDIYGGLHLQLPLHREEDGYDDDMC